MTQSNIRARAVDMLKRSEGKVNALLAVMSMFALALMVSNQFVHSDWHIAALSTSWSSLQVVLRSVIWLLFVSSFITYATLSKKPFTYARNHILELIVCICWVPTHGTLNSYAAIFSLTRLVPLDILQLCGTLAHAWRVVRFTAKRFSQHPVFVTGTAAMLLVGSASALLTYVEPKTFPTFWDGAWYSITTITTIGYGDLVPYSPAGRIISVVLIISGVSLAGVFIGLVSELVRGRLLKSDHVSMSDLHQDLAANKAILEELLEERKEQNELLRRLLPAKLPEPPSDKLG